MKHARIRKFVHTLQGYSGRFWYPPLIGALAAADNFIVIVPTDGILISSTMLTPRRWLTLSLCVSIGSTIGAMLLAMVVELQGLPWVLELYPGIDQSQVWLWTVQFFDRYGLLVVFVIALSPLMKQPS